MTTLTLPLPGGVNIAFGSQLDTKARVLKASFGSGYVQRVGDGINSVVGLYNVSFQNLLRAEAQTLLDFLKARGGYQAFYYTPPGESVARMWVCEEWSRQHTDATIDTITAKFQEVFTP